MLLNKIIKPSLIAFLFFTVFAINVHAQTEKGLKEKRSFPSDGPIGRVLSKTVFLPMELVGTGGEAVVEPKFTEKQAQLYDMEKIPLNLEADVNLLIDKKTGKVDYMWSEKEARWLQLDGEAASFLQERYKNREELRVQAKEYRTLKDMRKRLDEMTRTTTRDLQRTDQTRR